ncbi:glutaredoxin family protein, partial [Sesbania bispinosa]
NIKTKQDEKKCKMHRMDDGDFEEMSKGSNSGGVHFSGVSTCEWENRTRALVEKMNMEYVIVGKM